MAIIKHIASKNADYGAAEKYLMYQHDGCRATTFYGKTL